VFNDPAIAGSWPALVDCLDRTGRTQRWATQAPALTGLHTIDALPALVAVTVPPARADQVNGGAGPARRRRRRRRPRRGPGRAALAQRRCARARRELGHLSDSIVTVVVGELTCQIRRYPWRRRTRAHAINLLLNTKQALLRGELRAGLPGQPAVVLVDPHDPAFRQLDTANQDNEDIDVVDMLLWAGGHGIAPLQDLLMLLDLESRRGYGHAARQHVAHDLGINERTVRRHRDRALDALRQASNAYLATVA
jgi:hypothetical protein